MPCTKGVSSIPRARECVFQDTVSAQKPKSGEASSAGMLEESLLSYMLRSCDIWRQRMRHQDGVLVAIRASLLTDREICWQEIVPGRLLRVRAELGN